MMKSSWPSPWQANHFFAPSAVLYQPLSSLPNMRMNFAGAPPSLSALPQNHEITWAPASFLSGFQPSQYTSLPVYSLHLSLGVTFHAPDFIESCADKVPANSAATSSAPSPIDFMLPPK